MRSCADLRIGTIWVAYYSGSQINIVRTNKFYDYINLKIGFMDINGKNYIRSSSTVLNGKIKERKIGVKNNE